ncbi:MAG TPA: alpha/beta hydrolase [Casimicrobiaceae bacterium]|nr:alpha/beta hydrolase [Casimicrobiaceae bacterium]
MHASSRSTVVLLHSSASSSRQWQALAATLAPRHVVHAVDLYGHGARPPWPGPTPLALEDEAKLVVPLLAEAGGGHVVGHSYGAAVALKVAALRPDLVRSVAVYEPVFFAWLADNPMHAIAGAIRSDLERGEAAAAARRFVDFWSGEGAWQSMAAGAQAAIAARMPSIVLHFLAMFDEPLRAWDLARLAMPMLFLMGSRTVTVTQRLAAIARRALPHARHEVLPGLGHMGPVTHAGNVNRRIEASLARHAAAAEPAAA